MNIDPILLSEIDEFNRDANAETPFTARIRVVRAATKALYFPIHFDSTDWLAGEIAKDGVAMCVIDVYRFGLLYLTLPNMLQVHYTDHEYLSDNHSKAVDAFNEAYRKGVIY